MKKHKIEHFFDALSVYLNVSSNKLAATGFGALLASNVGAPITLGVGVGMGINIILKAIEREVRGAGMLPKEIDNYMYLYTAKNKALLNRKTVH